MTRKLILHLPAHTKKTVDAGTHNFFKILQQAFENCGFETQTLLQKKHGGTLARLDKNYHIFHIDGAKGPRALNVRKAHFFPFWRLEPAGNRHAPALSKLKFDPSAINGIEAQDFFNKICVRNLPAHPEVLPIKDFVFIPLQGRLLKKRKWQYADLRQMVETVLRHEPNRKILIKPHPREVYSEAENKLVAELTQHAQIEITNADTYGLLSQCAYVATQNSAVAFEGFLYQKPAILFANSDFSHICHTVTTPQEADAAFKSVLSKRPSFEKYLYWYLQLNCINAGRDEAAERLLQMARDQGWDVPNASAPTE